MVIEQEFRRELGKGKMLPWGQQEGMGWGRGGPGTQPSAT